MTRVAWVGEPLDDLREVLADFDCRLQPRVTPGEAVRAFRAGDLHLVLSEDACPRGVPCIRVRGAEDLAADLGTFLDETDGVCLDEDTLHRLGQSLGGEKGLVPFLRVFVQEGGRHVALMEQALADSHNDAVCLAAHSLKPGSGLLGAQELHAACLALERACKAGDAVGLAGRVARVRSAFEHTCRELEAHGRIAQEVTA